MLEGDDLLFARFGDARPGRMLITIENAALPVTIVTTDVLAQERKALPLLNEFILRFAQAELRTVADIAAVTGLDEALVATAIAEEVSAGNLTYKAISGSVALTPQGSRVFVELEAVQPTQKQLSLAFDRMTWRLADYPREDLQTKKEVTDNGSIILPASRTSRIGADDIAVPTINTLLRSSSARRAAIEILTVRKIRPNTHRYLPVKLLVYGDSDASEVELSVVVDHDVSPPHDLALAELGAAERLGIRVAAPAKRPTLSAELEAQRVAVDSPPPTSTSERPVNEVSSSDTTVRGVGVFEHRQLLSQAMTQANDRLLLISPWVKSAVVDTSFLGHLEQRLRKGCVVHIAHGYGSDDKGSDDRAISRLGNLQRRYPERFTLARLRNTHAKILIFDDTWVSTSFNWLSFRGDPDRTYRMEEGTLVRFSEQVSEEYARYVRLIEEQRID